MSNLKNNFSVVICTYNRSPFLMLCLNSLVKAENKHSCIEVIVVDNNSKDNTKEVVLEYINKYPNWNIKYVFENKQGISSARTSGYKNAKGTFVVYLEDDAQANSDWLEKITYYINNYDIDSFIGSLYPFYLNEKPHWFKDSYEIRSLGNNILKLNKNQNYVYGANFGIKRELLDKTCGFDQSMGMKAGKIGYGEEPKIIEEIMQMKKDFNLYFFPQIIVYHHVPPYKMKVPYFVERYLKLGYFGAFLYQEKKSLSKHIYETYLILKIPFLLIRTFLFRNRKKYQYYQNYLIEIVLPLLCYLGEKYAKMVQLFQKEKMDIKKIKNKIKKKFGIFRSIPKRYYKRPDLLKIEITNSCDCRCNFCAYKKVTRKKVNMDEKTFDKVVKDYVDIGGGTVGLLPVVGENLLNRNVISFAKKLKDTQKITCIIFYTNLLALSSYSEEEIEALLGSIDVLHISTGANKEDFKQAFGVDRFDKFLDGVECLVRYKKKTGKSPDITFLGRSAKYAPEVDPKLKEMVEFLTNNPLEWLQSYCDWNGDIDNFGQEQPIIKYDKTGKELPVCDIGAKASVVFSNGKAGFCSCSDAHAQLVIGDIHENSLKDILSGKKRKEYLNSFPKGTMHPWCAKCGFYRPFNADTELIETKK